MHDSFFGLQGMEVLMITRQQAKIKKIEGNNAICTK
jgi:hypothetical protein